MNKEKFFESLNKRRGKKTKLSKIELSILSDTEAIHERLMDNFTKFSTYANQLKGLKDDVSDVGEAIRQDWDAFSMNLNTLKEKANDLGVSVDDLGLDYIVSVGDRFQETADAVREVQVGVFNISGLHLFR